MLNATDPKKAFMNGNTTPAASPLDFAPRGDYRRGDPRSMVPVRLAGAEVTEGFCTKSAVLS